MIEVIFETKKKKIVFEVALMKKNGQILITEKTLSDIK